MINFRSLDSCSILTDSFLSAYGILEQIASDDIIFSKREEEEMLHSGDRIACLDYSSHKCPCFLARSGKCPECSILNGEQICHCNWTGFCLLLELQWNRDSLLDSMHTERVKVESLRPIGEGVLELVLLLEEASMFRRNPGVYVSVLVCFDSFPSVWGMGVCSHLDDHEAIHLIVPDYCFAGIERPVHGTGECTLVGWGKGALDLSVLSGSCMNKSIIVGTGINQVTVVQIVEWLQQMEHSDMEVWLSRNGPAIQFVIRQLRSLKIQPRLFPSESLLFSSLGESLNSGFVDNIYCACNTVNCGKIIEMTSETVCRPLLTFFDLGAAHRVAKQFRRRIIR